MPVSNISFSNINMAAQEGFTAKTASNIRFYNIDFSVGEGSAFNFVECCDIILNDIRSEKPLPGIPIVTLEKVKNAFITNCFQITPADIFYTTDKSEVILKNNEFKNIIHQPQ